MGDLSVFESMSEKEFLDMIPSECILESTECKFNKMILSSSIFVFYKEQKSYEDIRDMCESSHIKESEIEGINV